MEKQEIDLKSRTIINKIKDSNIKAIINNGQDIEASDLLLYLMEIGSLTANTKKYYEDIGFPTVRKEDQLIKMKSKDMVNFDLNINECYKNYSEMKKLVNINNNEFMHIRNIRKLFFSIESAVFTGQYYEPDDKSMSEMKKELVCKSFDIFKNIWKNKQIDYDYKYLINSEYEMLQNKYSIYKLLFSDESSCEIENKKNIPQFGQELENLFSYIDNNTKYDKKVNVLR